MEQIMRKPEQFAPALGDERMDRLVGIKEARPGHVGNLAGKRGGAMAAVKRVVAVPQRQPVVEIASFHKADGDIAGHVDSSMRAAFAGVFIALWWYRIGAASRSQPVILR